MTRPDPTRARRVLAVACVAVAVSQLGVGLWLDTTPPEVRFRQGAAVLRRARALGGAPYVLLLGSSRFWEIDTGAADATLSETLGAGHPPAVQGAVAAGDPVVAEFLLDRLFAQGTPPALVAVEISPETLANPAPWVAEHAIRFFTWHDVAVWAGEIVVGGEIPQVAAARFAPIQLYRRELLTWFVGTKPPYLRVPPDAGAKDPPHRPAPVQPVVSIGRDAVAAEPPARKPPNGMTLFGLRQTRRWLRHYRLDGGVARALEHVLSRCRDAGVRVVLVGVPVSSWVRDLYTPEIERRFLDYMADVGRRYDVEFLDYRARMPDRSFKDHHHMSTAGGGVFARLLVNEAIAPRWTRTPAP